MKNFNYNVNSYFADGCEMTLRTNNVGDAIGAFFENVENGVHCDIVNGFTGEVLALCGHPEGEDFVTDEMALMMLGYMCAENWGEDEDAEPTHDVPADGVVVDPIIAMLDDLVAMGKAVKLPS